MFTVQIEKEKLAIKPGTYLIPAAWLKIIFGYTIFI